GTSPKKKHERFMRLSKEDRKLVRQCTAVLRVADALDRRHTQRVKAIHLRIGRVRVSFSLEGTDSLEIEASAAKSKAELFESVFGRKTRFLPVTAVIKPLRIVRSA